jgi:hypothetical protein
MSFWQRNPTATERLFELRKMGRAYSIIAEILTREYGEFVGRNACMGRHSKQRDKFAALVKQREVEREWPTYRQDIADETGRAAFVTLRRVSIQDARV